MNSNLIINVRQFSNSQYYWLILAVLSVMLISTALLFQHFFDEPPCVMCIQVRLWLSLLLALSVVALIASKHRVVMYFMHVAVILVTAALVERSYMLLGTERGFVLSDCGFDVGLPDWFSLDTWLPSIYGVETSCGYTPELLLGITMAEALMLLSSCLLILSVTMFVSYLKKD